MENQIACIISNILEPCWTPPRTNRTGANTPSPHTTEQIAGEIKAVQRRHAPEVRGQAAQWDSMYKFPAKSQMDGPHMQEDHHTLPCPAVHSPAHVPVMLL